MALGIKLLLAISAAKCLWMTFVSSADPPGKYPWETCPHLALDTRPSFYAIFVQPNMDNGNYTGSVEITIHTTAAKPYLWLHANEVNFTSTVVLALPSKTAVPIKMTIMYYPHDFIVIKFVNDLPAGDYLLQFVYYGTIRDRNLRYEYFYSYNDSDHVDSFSHILYSSYFFPSFGEGQFKAVFQVRIVQPSQNYKVISNTLPQSIARDSPSLGLNTITFEKTPKMRLDSIFMMVEQLESLPTATTRSGIAVSIYGRTKVVNKLQRTLKLAVKFLDFYTDYFGISQPIKKIDIVALPPSREYELPGGAELWGLIFQVEQGLAYDESTSAGDDLEYKDGNIAHMVAYSFFGELVSPKSFSEFLLGIGVASYFQIKAVKNVHPTWDMKSFRLINSYYSLRTEGKASGLPLAVSVPTEDDTIAVGSMDSKGAAILEMLECIMGEENTKKGYIDYLKKHEYSTAVVPDLWSAMQTYAPVAVDVPTVMSTWTLQNTLPMVSVARSGNTLTLTQMRFVDDGNFTNDQPPSPYNYKWEIQLTIKGSNNFHLDKPLFLGLKNPTAVVQLPTGVSWIKVNVDDCGFFRTNYSSEDWNRLANLFADDINALGPVERANVLEDVLTFAELEYVTYETALKMTSYMCKETELLPFLVLLKLHIDNIASLLKSTSGYASFREYFSRLLAPHIDITIWNFPPEKTPDMRWRQYILIKHACALGVKSCVKTAKRIFLNWLLQCGPKPPVDIISTVYNTAMQQSGKEWKLLWRVYENESDSDEKNRLREALCQIREPRIIKNIFDVAPREDLISFLKACVDNPVGVIVVWDYLQENLQYLATKFNSSFGDVLTTVTDSFSTDLQLKEVESFFKEIPENLVSADDRKTILEGIKKRITKIQKFAASLTEWFKEALQNLSC